MEKQFANFAQKALYLGMGLASLAADKASNQLSELRKQAQKLTEELVTRGEMSAEEARSLMDGFIKQGTKKPPSPVPSPAGPRKITIDEMDEDSAESGGSLALTESARLRQQIQDLQAKLEQLKSP